MTKYKYQPINMIDLNEQRASRYAKYRQTKALKLLHKNFTTAAVTAALALTISNVYPQHKTYTFSNPTIQNVQINDNNYEITLSGQKKENISKEELDRNLNITQDAETQIKLSNETIVYVSYKLDLLDSIVKTGFKIMGYTSSICAGIMIYRINKEKRNYMKPKEKRLRLN